ETDGWIKEHRILGTRVDVDRIVPCFSPPNLLAVAWLQLLQLFSGGIIPRICICGRLIIPDSAVGPSAHKTSCSGSCRVRVAVSRKEAHLLRRKKWPVAKIADKLRVTPALVNEWLTKPLRPYKKSRRVFSKNRQFRGPV